jgi:uncharacterized protein (TIGR02118 family)
VNRAAQRKIVCALRGPFEPSVPPVESLEGCAVYLPAANEPAEHPDDLAGIVCVWVGGASRELDPTAWFPGTPVDAYLVEERVHIDYDRDWPDGHASPGLHRTVFVRRAPSLTRAEMAAHWQERHAPLVPQHHPGFWLYVQNPVLETLTPGSPEVDGVAEMHFRSGTDLRDRFYASDESRRLIAADVERFLDRGAGWRILAEERWLVTPSTRRPPGR